MSKRPVLIDMDDSAAPPDPARAPPVPDPEAPPAPDGRAMQTVAQLGAHRPSWLARVFWGLLLTILGAVISVSAWDFVSGLMARNVVLGAAISALLVAFGVICAIIALREIVAMSRLSRIDGLHRAAGTALRDADLGAARRVTRDLSKLYADRKDTAWGRDRLRDYGPDQLEAADLLALAERELLAPLDQAARVEIEAAARQVATVTALVPLAFADVIAALTANLRMIRRIAEIYGGRAGVLGGWRLARAVMTHLVATGAVAVGDDLVSSVAGGGILSKVSRRFGEGIVNGALTARVGVAAMEVCRPLPFRDVAKPSVSALVSRALTGLFARA